ncbi:MAG: AAA family ATPase, partial [Omnitrophica WOR_2 bacterium]
MFVSLLATKLYIPPARPNAIARSHLINKLLSGLDHPGSFTLVSGPAGFGKTTLVSKFVSQLQRPVAWVSLDEGDNDAVQFWTYLITACQLVWEDIGGSALELFNSQQELPPDTAPSILINDLTADDRQIVLVLDDYHTIQTRSIHAGMQFLLDHLPPNLHLIVATRTDPPWPLARMRASNQLVEIRTQDLRFSVNETLEFLNRTMGLKVSPEDAASLEERTEGWAAGLQLAALSLQGRSDTPAFVKAFSGSDLYVADYLVEEVLQRQPPDIRKFLLQTSLLKRMNAGLCEAVTGCQDGQTILQAIRHDNAFIIPLDSQGHWFRYHHLFAELLQSHLNEAFSKDEIAALHLHAATWFEKNQYYVEAVQHAFAAKNYEKAASLVDQYGQEMFFSEQHSILIHWLEALPGEYAQSHPRLEIYRLLIDLLQGKLDMFEQTLIEKEKLIQSLPKSPENNRLRRRALVYLALFYAFQNTAKAIQIAEDVLAEIPEADLHTRAYLYSAFYRGFGMDGDIEKSAAAYRESFRLAEITGQYEMISNTTKIRTFDLCQYGRLDEAAEYCQRIVDAGAQRKSKVFFPAGPAYVGLAGIHLERNDLDKAEEYLAIGLDLCQRGALYGLFTGHVQKVRLLQAKGE